MVRCVHIHLQSSQPDNFLDENRASLLDAGLPQVLVSLIEAYTESFDFFAGSKPLPLSLSHLKVIRTAVGVLLNASVSYGQ